MDKKIEKLIKDNPDLADYFHDLHINFKKSLDTLLHEKEILDNKFIELDNKLKDLNLVKNNLLTERSSLDNKFEELKNKIKELTIENKNLSIKNTNLNQELEAVKFTLSKMNRTVFGTKSEKTVHKEEERNLFNLNEAEANQNLNAVEPTISKVIKKRKTKTTKAESFKNLESREIIYDLDDNDKTCHSCNVSLVEVGSKTRETIEIMKKQLK